MGRCEELSGSDRVPMLTPVQTLTGPQWTSEPDHGSMIVRTNGTMGRTLGSGLTHTQTTYLNIVPTNTVGGLMEPLWDPWRAAHLQRVRAVLKGDPLKTWL